jgi:hypothetical protein
VSEASKWVDQVIRDLANDVPLRQAIAAAISGAVAEALAPEGPVERYQRRKAFYEHLEGVPLQYVNALWKAGYRSADQVRDAPDDALLGCRMIGLVALRAIRNHQREPTVREALEAVASLDS